MLKNTKFSEKNTFRYVAPKLWNMLENEFKNVSDLKYFKVN